MFIEKKHIWEKLDIQTKISFEYTYVRKSIISFKIIILSITII